MDKTRLCQTDFVLFNDFLLLADLNLGLAFEYKIYFVSSLVGMRLLDLPGLQTIDVTEKIPSFKEVALLHFFCRESNLGLNVFEV